MNNMPKVSVCMPTYNHAAFVAQAILSVIEQDYPNIELIISDDCSTDDTSSVIKSFKDRYPEQIKLQLHPKNLGISKNISSIYPLITGDYVCWFSGDDLYLPGKIKQQVRLMQHHPDCVFSFHAVKVIDHSGNYLYNFNNPMLGLKLHTQDIAQNLMRDRCFICANSVMVNRKRAQNVVHQEKVGLSSDWLLLFELATKGRVVYLDQAFVSYRRHANNCSKTINVNNEACVYDYILAHYPAYKKDVLVGRAKLYAVYVFKYLTAGNLKMSGYCTIKCLCSTFSYPVNAFHITNKIYSELLKRLCLLFSTGTLNR